MDYAPPPELRPQFEFIARAKAEYKWSPGAFAPVFRIRDLLGLEEQTEPKGEICMRELQERGRCDLDGLKAANNDPVIIRFDRHCIVMERGGALPGVIALPVPAEAAKLLPLPKTTAPALSCPAKAEEKTSFNLGLFWQDKAGVRQALAPAVPQSTYKI